MSDESREDRLARLRADRRPGPKLTPDAQRPATTRPGDQPAALPSATAESDRIVP